MIDKLKS